MAAEHEMEELQLQLESKVCGLGVDALAELAEHYKWRRKIKEGWHCQREFVRK